MSDETIVVMDVAVAVIFDGPRMLVNKRPDDGYYGKWWEWPGGKVMREESEEQCARRELKEEIGIEAGPLRLFDRRVAEYPGRRVRLSFFVGNVLPGQNAKSDALEHQWLLPADVAKLKFLDANRPVLEKLVAEMSTRRR